MTMLRVTTLLLLISLVTCRPPQWLLDAQSKGRQAVGDVGEHGRQAWGQLQGAAGRLGEELEQGGKDLHDKVHAHLDGSNEESNEEESNEEESNEEKDEIAKRDWDAFKAWVQDKWTKTKKAGSKAIDKVKEAGSTAGKKIKGVFTHDDKDGATTGARAYREITDVQAKRDWADIQAWLKSKWQKTKQGASDARSKVKGWASTAGSKIKGVFTGGDKN